MKRRRVATVSGLGLVGTYLLLRPKHLRWGATDQECSGPLPGDDLVLDPDLASTRAITVRAWADQVWPWIAQLGQGRGGFYTYDFLENLARCDIHSADRIVPEWQDVKIGDAVRLAPEVALEVAAVDPGRSLVLRGGVPMGNTPPPYDFSWAFVLREQPDGTTRLLVRERYGYTQWWAPLLVEPVEAISFLMHQRMLRGIRDRAEMVAVPSGRPIPKPSPAAVMPGAVLARYRRAMRAHRERLLPFEAGGHLVAFIEQAAVRLFTDVYLPRGSPTTFPPSTRRSSSSPDSSMRETFATGA